MTPLRRWLECCFYRDMQTTTYIDRTIDQERTIDQLNSFLRGELAASESYRDMIARTDSPAQVEILEQCARSHEERARLLGLEIRRRGGQTDSTRPVWSSVVAFVEDGVSVLGCKAAMFVLEEGERRRSNEYRRGFDNLDAAARHFIDVEVLPDQIETQDAMAVLKELPLS